MLMSPEKKNGIGVVQKVTQQVYFFAFVMFFDVQNGKF